MKAEEKNEHKHKHIASSLQKRLAELRFRRFGPHTVAACLGLRARWAGLPHVGGLLAACDFPSVA